MYFMFMYMNALKKALRPWSIFNLNKSVILSSAECIKCFYFILSYV